MLQLRDKALEIFVILFYTCLSLTGTISIFPLLYIFVLNSFMLMVQCMG